MIVLDLFPAGVLQLWDSIANGYWHARQPAFTMSGPFHALEWVRLVGDGVFLVAGVVPLVTATLMVVLDPATYRSGSAHAWRDLRLLPADYGRRARRAHRVVATPGGRHASFNSRNMRSIIRAGSGASSA